MYIKDMSSNGPATDTKDPPPNALLPSSSLPFGKYLPLSSISGPTYLTTQTLVQQVAYLLSDKLFTYSPESFYLDVAASGWSDANEQNANGYTTALHKMQIREGAGSIALGYMFSKDFNLKRRHIPQGIVTSSSALRFLQPALDQLSLLYAVSNPLVAHIAAVDYDGSNGGALVTDYVSAMRTADEIGFGLVASQSAHEAQHMALFSTLLARCLPVFHIYDGIRTGRDTTRVIDVLDQSGLRNTYWSVLDSMFAEHNHLSNEGKALRTLKALNDELGTDYRPFEYFGHEEPEAVLVAFGSVESAIASPLATNAAISGTKIGFISVRLYRPFLEDEFIKAIPKSVKTVAVLGQVYDISDVEESGVHSPLFEDVLAALTYARTTSTAPALREIKYARSESWTPEKLWKLFDLALGNSGTASLTSTSDTKTQQYVFWNLDDSSTSSASGYLAQALAKDSSQNVSFNAIQDNLIQGGIRRTDLRKSQKTETSTYPITSADAIVIDDVKILENIDVLSSVRDGARVILSLPSVKDEDVEKKLPASFRLTLARHGIELYLVDSSRTTIGNEIPDFDSLTIQTAFLRVVLSRTEEIGLQKLAAVSSNLETLQKVSADLEKTLRQVEIPKEWSEIEYEKHDHILPTAISANSFTTFDKTEEEPPSQLRTWQTSAKALLFKEAYHTEAALRPEIPQKSYTIHVKENRRLTPLTYDRNIFHIEFDIGTSGLKYDIGEALGIHAENFHEHVMEFIKWYELNPDDIIELASRENPSTVFETRTIYQTLKQNLDIFGRPPKKFYESLAEFATDANDKKNLLTIAGPEGFKEFTRRAEVDTITYVDVLQEFPSARPSFHDLARLITPLKRREYSIASCQAVTPTSIALMVVVVNWTDPRGRDRFGHATQYLSLLAPGSPVTVSVKPSVMKLPPLSTQPLILAGLGTGLAPFRAFVQHRALEKSQGKPIGPVLLYMGSRHQREEYCYGEEWEAYARAGVITLLGRAFSRDQPQKIYIQDRMRQTIGDIVDAYVKEPGCFYLCGPTWPVPDVTQVLEEALEKGVKEAGGKWKKGDGSREIMKLKDEGRYVLEVY